MALLLKKAWGGYLFLFEDLTDPRTNSWPLVAKPYQAIALLGLYLMFVLKWGPKWMQNRRPFNLDKILIIYNFIQILLCLYLVVNALRAAWLKDYKWICEPVNYSNSPKPLEIASLVYFFYFVKITDLLDTIFFVLRKKNNQVSFLHVYHHTGMVVLAWAVTTYLPGGHGTLIGVINSVVHIFMYSYYLLTVAIPSIKNSISIKKLVTQIQIVQFLWCVTHMALIVFRPDCEYPRWTSAIILPQNLFMLVLFIDFYIKAYVKNPKANEKAVSQKELNNEIANGNGVQANGSNICENDKNIQYGISSKTKTNGHHKQV